MNISRVSTGITELDYVLKGGIPQYSACVIAGLPGAGKTILAQQILFSNAAPNSKSMYLTTVSEPAAKVVRYQQQFSFFNPDLVGEDFIYMDLGEIIREQGPEKSLDVLTKLMKEYRPRQIAIDSFRALHDLIPDRQAFRAFVFELAVKLSSWSTTAFLIGEYTSEDTKNLPEFAVADTIISLTVEPSGGSTRRYLEVLKLRGSDFISGKHLYKLSDAGIQIFPRIFASGSETIRIGDRKIPTGISQLDALLDGGIRERSVVAITGSAGTGKSLLGLQFVLEGARSEGEPGVYYSFEESDTQLRSFAGSFGWEVDDLIKNDMLRIVYHEPIDISPEEQLIRIRSLIDKIGAKRVVIDSMTPLMGLTNDETNIRQLVFQMSMLFKAAGATALIISDVPVGSERVSKFGPEESVFDGIIIMKNLLRESRRERFMEIYKMRGSKHVSGDQRFKITDNGIVVFPKPGVGER